MFSLNRVVALLTPVFSAGAAVGSAWLLKHFPGVPVPSSSELLGVEVTVATSAGAAALKWLHGHQAWEQRLAKLDPQIDLVGSAVKVVTKADPQLKADVEGIVQAELARLLASVKFAAPVISGPAAATAESGGAA
jgi:hypothetical protein